MLTRFGHTDVAYKLLLQETYPSWLYPVKKGATTIWERWDGIKPDGTFQTANINSFNHYAYGAVGDWMYRVIAGIDNDPLAPAYKAIVITPKLGGDFTSATGELETMYGKIKSSWKIENQRMYLNIMIPPNTSARVVFPRSISALVTENSLVLNKVKGVKAIVNFGDSVECESGLDNYNFEYDLSS